MLWLRLYMMRHFYHRYPSGIKKSSTNALKVAYDCKKFSTKSCLAVARLRKISRKTEGD